MGARDCCATLMALLLPPVAVFMVQGCGMQLCINILLCVLCWIPGIIHALFVVCATDNKPVEQHIHHHHTAPQPAPQQPYQPAPNPPHPMQPMAPPPGTQYPPQPVAAPGFYPPQPAPGYPAQPPPGYPPKV